MQPHAGSAPRIRRCRVAPMWTAPIGGRNSAFCRSLALPCSRIWMPTPAAPQSLARCMRPSSRPSTAKEWLPTDPYAISPQLAEWSSQCSLGPRPFPTRTCISWISEPQSRSSSFPLNPGTCYTQTSTESSPFHTILPRAFPKQRPKSATRNGRLSTCASHPDSRWKSWYKLFRPGHEDIYAERCLQALCAAVRHSSGLPDLLLFEARAGSSRQYQGGRHPHRSSRPGLHGGPFQRLGADRRVQALPGSRRDGKDRRVCETDQRRCRRSREARPTFGNPGNRSEEHTTELQ